MEYIMIIYTMGMVTKKYALEEAVGKASLRKVFL